MVRSSSRGGGAGGGPEVNNPRSWGLRVAVSMPGAGRAHPLFGGRDRLPPGRQAPRAYGPAMAIARRDLLGLGAAVAMSLATSSCRHAGSRRGRASGGSPLPTRDHGPARFPGQPPPGSLYYGASVPYNRSLPGWEKKLGSRLSVHRSYFTPDHNETAQLVRRCQHDLFRDRLPHVSVKPWWTWRSIARGEHDDWLTAMLTPLGAESGPVFFTLHHEPENDAGEPGMWPKDYVAMQRRVIGLAAELAPLVTVVPVMQHWTFDPLTNAGDPSAWIVPEASVIGLDIYNPWSPSNGKEWRSFGSKVDEVIDWFGDTPLVIGEYGCRDDPTNPGMAAEWLRDAAEYARTHNIVSMSYFNSGLNSPDGSWALRGETEHAFAQLLRSDWVARPR